MRHSRWRVSNNGWLISSVLLLDQQEIGCCDLIISPLDTEIRHGIMKAPKVQMPSTKLEGHKKIKNYNTFKCYWPASLQGWPKILNLDTLHEFT